jgi:hypothetical protein
MVEVIYKALLSGTPADDIQPLVAGLTDDERDMLLCMLSGIRNELEANCVERAHEVDRVLFSNGFARPICHHIRAV